jgi:hypothetical protein
MNNLATQLKAIGACSEAVEWAKDHETLQVPPAANHT